MMQALQGESFRTSPQGTVFVVDPDKTVRAQLCEMARNMGLAYEGYTSAESFLAAYDASRPGCLILEVVLPGVSGLQVLEELTVRGGPLPLVFLTEHGKVFIAVRAMRAGAVDFLEKPVRAGELWDAVATAIQLDRQRRTRWKSRRRIEQRLAKLTPDDRKLLEMIACGKTNAAIASSLDVSVRTIEYRRSELKRRVKADSVDELGRLVVLANMALGPPPSAS